MSPDQSRHHRELATALSGSIEGEVRFDRGSRGLYATDASSYRQVPIGVVIPRNIDDIAEAISVCSAFDVPVLPRGGGTSISGQCCNVAVVIDTSKHLRNILEIDPSRKIARVEPGVILDDLQDAARAHGLTFGPDPATHAYCTIGGMIGNNACGVHSVVAGRTSDNLEELEILTYGGQRMRVGATSGDQLQKILEAGGERAAIYRGLESIAERYGDLIRERYPKIPRRVSGYNLDELLEENGFNVARALTGSEGTCAFVLEATIRLINRPGHRCLVILGYPDIYSSADHVPQILEAGPAGLEAVDDILIGNMRKKRMHEKTLPLLPEGRGWLFVEFGGESRADALAAAGKLVAALEKDGNPPTARLFDEIEQAKKMWRIRESALGASAFVPGQKDSWEGWEDAAVAPARLGDYLRDFRKLLERHELNSSLYGHFGDGCIHSRIDFDFKTAEGVGRFRAFVDEAADLVVSYGGSLSGEHGDGQARAELLPKMFGPELVRAFGEFKALWDPRGKMNPGKVVDPLPLDRDLRMGPAYKPWEPETHFKFPEDAGSFARASSRCVGVGRCRRMSGGIMCPSYMVTSDETHSTRGRAHLLFEMMQGDPIRGGWRDHHVKEALDLCLACKGCKKECPVNVDVATYKAEFLSHYYQGRIRPRSAYAMGLINWWARAASHVPTLANFASHAPVLSHLVKRFAGIAPERSAPEFARETFKSWFRRRPLGDRMGEPVILFADTFINFFSPNIARAAVDVLESAGRRVVVPKTPLCCGRPLYDYGMLDLAKRQLRQILDSLRPAIRSGVPLVVLEPSCLAVFRDELTNLYPDDDDAGLLTRQSFTLAEFLMSESPRYEPPELGGKALVQTHCHQKSVIGFDADEELLSKIGLDFEVLDSGCCGMAGSFGFEKEKYEISMKAGERVLLPAVRDAMRDTLILSDGFSCREQILQGTGREALHIARVVQMAASESISRI